MVYLISAVEVESMYAWAMMVRQESTVADLLMSKTKSGFLITFTQNRRGTLQEEEMVERRQGEGGGKEERGER